MKLGNKVKAQATLMFTVIIMIMTLSSSQASEIDSFTGRYEELATLDHTNPSNVDILDEVTNKKILQAIEKANRSNIGCQVNSLFANMKEVLAGKNFLDVEGVYAVLENEMDLGKSPESSHHYQRLETPRNQSVYQKMTFTEGPFMYAHISSTFAVNHPRFGKMLIGADKLGHFFGQGYTYHVKAHTKDLSYALNWGENSEKGHMGLTTTGIYSHGDLAANYQGMKFWDQLIEQPNSFVLCVDGKWSKNPHRDFHWTEFLDPGMDEGNNCNSYRTVEIKNKVLTQQKNLKSQELQSEHHYQCPVSPKQCQMLLSYYQEENKSVPQVDLVNHLIHPECLNAAKAFNKAENKTSKQSKKRALKKELAKLQKAPICSQKVLEAPSSCLGSCRHLGSLISYFVKGQYEYLWKDQSKKLFQDYQTQQDHGQE